MMRSIHCPLLTDGIVSSDTRYLFELEKQLTLRRCILRTRELMSCLGQSRAEFINSWFGLNSSMREALGFQTLFSMPSSCFIDADGKFTAVHINTEVKTGVVFIPVTDLFVIFKYEVRPTVQTWVVDYYLDWRVYPGNMPGLIDAFNLPTQEFKPSESAEGATLLAMLSYQWMDGEVGDGVVDASLNSWRDYVSRVLTPMGVAQDCRWQAAPFKQL